MNYLLYVSREQVTSYYIGVMIGGCIVGVICGFVGRMIVSSKNYPSDMNHGFAWGFWLGLIGLIVCACKPNFNETFMSMQRNINYNNWWCSCGTSNSANSNYCIACGGRKPNTGSNFGSSAKVKDTDWRCSCGALNKEYETSCHRCGTRYADLKKSVNKPNVANNADNTYPAPHGAHNQSDTEVSVGIFEWKCPSCGRINSKSRSTCSKCNAPRYSNPAPDNAPNPNTITDQLTELKSLLDNGLITEEEFNAKKKQILGL